MTSSRSRRSYGKKTKGSEAAGAHLLPLQRGDSCGPRGKSAPQMAPKAPGPGHQSPSNEQLDIHKEQTVIEVEKTQKPDDKAVHGRNFRFIPNRGGKFAAAPKRKARALAGYDLEMNMAKLPPELIAVITTELCMVSYEVAEPRRPRQDRAAKRRMNALLNIGLVCHSWFDAISTVLFSRSYIPSSRICAFRSEIKALERRHILTHVRHVSVELEDHRHLLQLGILAPFVSAGYELHISTRNYVDAESVVPLQSGTTYTRIIRGAFAPFASMSQLALHDIILPSPAALLLILNDLPAVVDLDLDRIRYSQVSSRVDSDSIAQPNSKERALYLPRRLSRRTAVPRICVTDSPPAWPLLPLSTGIFPRSQPFGVAELLDLTEISKFPGLTKEDAYAMAEIMACSALGHSEGLQTSEHWQAANGVDVSVSKSSEDANIWIVNIARLRTTYLRFYVLQEYINDPGTGVSTAQTRISWVDFHASLAQMGVEEVRTFVHLLRSNAQMVEDLGNFLCQCHAGMPHTVTSHTNAIHHFEFIQHYLLVRAIFRRDVGILGMPPGLLQALRQQGLGPFIQHCDVEKRYHRDQQPSLESVLGSTMDLQAILPQSGNLLLSPFFQLHSQPNLFPGPILSEDDIVQALTESLLGRSRQDRSQLDGGDSHNDGHNMRNPPYHHSRVPTKKKALRTTHVSRGRQAYRSPIVQPC